MKNNQLRLTLDPPWKFATRNPSPGAAVKYDKLTDDETLSFKLSELVTEGFIFNWTIPSSDE